MADKTGKAKEVAKKVGRFVVDGASEGMVEALMARLLGTSQPTQPSPPAGSGAGAQIANLVTATGFDLKEAAARELGPQSRADLNAHFVGQNNEAEDALRALRALEGK